MHKLEFEELLAIYSSDFNKWPEDQAKDAKQFLSSSGDARKAYEVNHNIDNLLSEYKIIDPSEGLQTRIVDYVLSHPKKTSEVSYLSFVKKFVLTSEWRYGMTAGIVAAAIYTFTVLLLDIDSTTDDRKILAENKIVEKKIVYEETISDEAVDEVLYTLYEEDALEEELLGLL